MRKALFSGGVSRRAILLGVGASAIAGCGVVEQKNKEVLSESLGLSISSPNDQIALKFSLVEGRPSYSVSFNGREVVSASTLGLKLKSGLDFSQGLTVRRVVENLINASWEQPWGEQRIVDDQCRELQVYCTSSGREFLTLCFRVYDDAVAFRYLVEGGGGEQAIVVDELSEFALNGEWDSWSIEANKDKSYELIYEEKSSSMLEHIHTPVCFKNSENVHMAIHEACISQYPTMTLKENSGRLKCDLVAWSDGDLVKTNFPFRSPWRVVLIAETAGKLYDSRTILNLNEPSRLGGSDWIQPTKYVGIWWEFHRGLSTWGSGDKHGANTENMIQHIDFAAKNNIGAVLVEGWNVGWDGNWLENRTQFSYTESYSDFDLERVSAYAKEKGVGIMLQNETAGGIPNYDAQMDEAFAKYKSLGTKGIKTGCVAFGRDVDRIDDKGEIHKELHGGQYMVEFMHRLLEKAAANQLVVNMHEPVLTGGLRRTYPNLVAQEAARGQEYNAWDTEGGNPPNHVAVLPFTRLLDGPMDYTPGIMDLLFENSTPQKAASASIFENESDEDLVVSDQVNRINHTLAKELSLYVVLYSPIQMAADLLQNYENQPAFKFIKDVAVDWDETKTLAAEIGRYIIVARKTRGKDEYFLGGLTDESPRKFSIKLDFLKKGEHYLAEIYEDGQHAHWETNPFSMEISQRKVSANETLEISMVQGGGVAIRFSRVS